MIRYQYSLIRPESNNTYTMSESEFYRWLKERLPPNARVALGIGDDAAVLQWAASETPSLVVASDLIAEGVHFVAETPRELVGRKALAINLSDMAAMAARPVAAVVSLLAPVRTSAEDCRRVMSGALQLAEQYGVAIVGGDTNSWEGKLAVNVTVIGDLEGRLPLRRDTANAGDQILVTGSLGASILGKHIEFTPRIEESLWLANQGVRAAMDISDGFLLDLSRLASASGVAAELNLDKIPISKAAKGKLQRALSDGEDFELLIAAPHEFVEKLMKDWPFGIRLSNVGKFVAGSGLWNLESGQRVELNPDGYRHDV